MTWIRARDVSFTYGGANLLDQIDLRIEPGERIGLVGRNGTGKSTLLKLLAEELIPDSGVIERPAGLRVARLAQEVPGGDPQSVFHVVALGLGEQGDLVARIHQLSALERGGEPAVREELDRLHGELDAEAAWKLERQIEQAIDRLELDHDARFADLSSGMKRRTMFARALAREPDLLLLDEPTNHLDIDAIRWIEDFLLDNLPTLVFVTHDRVFLERLATRIVEIDRARLFDWSCDYATFLARKEGALAAEARQDALFDQKLAQEEIWIRQGVKARRTRNEGRVRALEQMREDRRARRARIGNVRLQFQEAERSGNLVIDARGVSHAFADLPVLDDVSVAISRGDKVGLVGPNGCGKTTLLRILLGELRPARGTVRFGTNLQSAYFDQLRAQLDEEKSAAENVAEGNEMVLFNGRPRHVLGYLRDFLFSEERARSLVRYLSGGERNRLLLARMFTKPANLLVLDEPTNDLDAETLELLEELLVEFSETVLVVSHDRAFLNHVATSLLVFEGAGRVKESVGGYDDWLRQQTPAARQASAERAQPPHPRQRRDSPRKLNYKEKQEFEALLPRIESLEAEQAQLHGRLADAEFYRQAGTEIAKVTARLEELHAELAAAYSRWEILDQIADG